MKKYPFKSIAFTSAVATHTLPGDLPGETFVGDFVLDFDSLVVPKNPCVVDYNHDDSEIVGRAKIEIVKENGETTLTADGDLISYTENDLAYRIAETAREIPFGISPTLDLLAAERIDVPVGSIYSANGRTYEGPLFVYKGAVLLGISVCPYPTDSNTNFLPLNKKGIKMLKLKSKFENDVQNSEEERPADAVENLQDAEKRNETDLEDDSQNEAVEPSPVKNAELQEYIDAFGLEKGVEYYQSGLPLEEAAASAYQDVVEENELLKAKLAKFENEAQEAQANEDDDKETELEDGSQSAPTNDDDLKDAAKLRGLVRKLGKRVVALEQDAAKLRDARKRGDRLGLSHSNSFNASRSYKDAFVRAVR